MVLHLGNVHLLHGVCMSFCVCTNVYTHMNIHPVNTENGSYSVMGQQTKQKEIMHSKYADNSID